jgi:hypothetical protein
MDTACRLGGVDQQNASGRKVYAELSAHSAQMTKPDTRTVSRARAALSPMQSISERTYTTKHGTTSTMRDLAIDLIRVDGGTQIRVETDVTQADGYAEDMAAGAVFPPIVVFFDEVEYWLADGFHRLIAAETIGRTEIAADVRGGTRRDAILYAVGSNTAHGLKRSNRDKRNAVMILLKDPEWSQWTDVRIADQCGVSSMFVGNLRRSIIKPFNDSGGRLVERGGTTFTMNTAAIGARPAPAPAATAGPDADEWHQTDIEDFAPTPQRVPRFTPEQRSEAMHIRYFVGEIDRRRAMTPAQAACASIGEIHSDAEQVARVVSWLTEFEGELHAEISRREGSEAAD